MEIGQIMKRLSDSRNAEQASVKTASVTPREEKTSPEALRNALRETLATAPETEKTASAPMGENPAGGLLKMAEDLTNAEEEALMKKASIYGAAMCDGFMTRYAQYEEAASQVAPPPPQAQTKTAAAAPQDPDLEMIKVAAADPEFQKFASENPDLVKEAYDLGYQQTMQYLVKEAQDDYNQGYNDSMETVHKVASASYKAGAVTINRVLRQLQNAA